MKRVLIASILGLAASVASSYGQASYIFDTYLASSYPASGVPTYGGQVTWTTTASLAPAGLHGDPITSNTGWSADLLWQVGTLTGDLGLAAPLSNAPGGSPGWIEQGNISFDPAYVNGPITFTINVWQGGPLYTSVSDTAKGSISWVDPGNPAGSGAASFTTMPQSPIYVALIVPEPATFALAGLGAAALLIFRKRQ